MEFEYINREKSLGINVSKNSDRPSGMPKRSLEDPQDILLMIYKAYNNDSYFRRACDIQRDLVFRNGYGYKYDNKDAKDYLEYRIRLLEYSMGMPWNTFLNSFAAHIVQYDNAFILKHRGNYGRTRKRITPFLADKPIIGYEILHPASITIVKDKESGDKISYIQSPIGSRPDIKRINNRKKRRATDYRLFDREDIIHAVTHSDSIYKFASPSKGAAIEDILLLREIEDKCSLLIQRFIFPFIHGKITGGQELVDRWAETLSKTPIDAIFWSSDKVEFDNVTSRTPPISGESYLKYYKERVFAGLAVSSVAMGEGDTANRATADSVIVQLQDYVKGIQKVIENYLNTYIISEILREGGFDPYSESGEVKFVFNEIDTTTKIAIEASQTQLYVSNVITQDEIRKELGYKPLNGDISGTYGGLYKDLPNITGVDNKTRPANQYKKRNSPKRSTE